MHASQQQQWQRRHKVIFACKTTKTSSFSFFFFPFLFLFLKKFKKGKRLKSECTGALVARNFSQSVSHCTDTWRAQIILASSSSFFLLLDLVSSFSFSFYLLPLSLFSQLTSSPLSFSLLRHSAAPVTLSPLCVWWRRCRFAWSWCCCCRTDTEHTKHTVSCTPGFIKHTTTESRKERGKESFLECKVLTRGEELDKVRRKNAKMPKLKLKKKKRRTYKRGKQSWAVSPFSLFFSLSLFTFP